MTDKNGAAFPSPEENSNHRHLERVVDELRMVLSDLGRPSPQSSESAQVELPVPEQKETSAPLSPNSFEAIKPEKASSNPVSSDADFWSGNVLGWTENNSTPDPLDNHPDLGNESGADANMSDPLGGINLEEFQGPLPSSGLNLGLDQPDNLWGLEEPLPESPELPVAPEPPLMNPAEKAVSKEPEPIHSNPFSPTFSSFNEESSVEEAPSAMVVPIPQTLDRKPEAAKPLEPKLNLDAAEAKPKDLIQIACIFPEGQEKLGQSFVAKLREMGEKSKKPINIQAVFVHPWASDKVDVPAWKKSALLSGADTMFILVSKANATTLKNLGNDPINQIKCRLVYLEHIPMKTLYADILADFQRRK